MAARSIVFASSVMVDCMTPPLPEVCKVLETGEMTWYFGVKSTWIKCEGPAACRACFWFKSISGVKDLLCKTINLPSLRLTGGADKPPTRHLSVSALRERECHRTSDRPEPETQSGFPRHHQTQGSVSLEAPRPRQQAEYTE